ncbi:fimbrial protein [Chromobacterium piscinae]|uniref:F4 family fimbrial subunit n=1 Tax=Chromobacterium piscinae TaxID=686831 RepID=UPI001E510F71|nr:fimbrial protein [Chromobacterium piscinae]MCD4506102.1 fimbrial protein [Chromobacterium piscinae]
MIKKMWHGGMLLAAWSLGAAATVVDSGEIRFRGYVIDQAPRWVWQIAAPDQMWDVDAADSVIDERGNQVFELKQKGALGFLEGHLKQVAERGGQGLTPLVALSSGGEPLLLEGDGSAAEQRFQAAVPVRNAETNEVIGQLRFTFEQALAVAQGQAETNAGKRLGVDGLALVSGDTVRQPQPAALDEKLRHRLGELMARIRDGIDHKLPASLGSGTVSQQVLANPEVTALGAAYASQLSDFILLWPQDKVPARWKATLNVSVTVQ